MEVNRLKRLITYAVILVIIILLISKNIQLTFIFNF
nr:MAG TPA: envelope protein [Caudoviricetes sp.]